MKKKQNEEFGIYLCIHHHTIFPREEGVIVLAMDMQSALSTVPDTYKIVRLDNPPTRIVINPEVMRLFERKCNRGNKK
jgi:hypothetical protein